MEIWLLIFENRVERAFKNKIDAIAEVEYILKGVRHTRDESRAWEVRWTKEKGPLGSNEWGPASCRLKRTRLS